MTRHTCTLIFISAFILFNTNLAYAGKFNESDLWKTECIGRYQIGVPSDVELAVGRFGISARPSFSDGQPAYFSQLDYLGEIAIFSIASESDFIKFKNNNVHSLEKMRKEFLDSGDEKKQKWGREMKGLAYDTPTLFGWDGDDRYPSINFLLNKKIISFGINNYADVDKALNKKHFNAFLNGFRPRSLYELPKQPGVCIPYSFIADDGTAPRNIAVTMRLIDHPDVEIFFQDSSYQLSPGEHSDSKQEILLFLDQYARKQKYVDTGFWGTHSIQMSGQKGRGNFFTIARKDDTIDYGYIASVKGDFTARTDPPAQMLYVIRTASRAKGAPVSKDEIKDIAEKIMASVKRHPVQ